MTLLELMETIKTLDVYKLHQVAFTFDAIIGLTKTPNEEILSDEIVKHVESGLEFFEVRLKKLELTHSLKYISVIRKLLTKPITHGRLVDELEILNVRIDHELEDLVVGFIPKEKVKYFQQEKLFGEDVFEKFPEAREEIKEAGNCFAINHNTACVFHLMRAAEFAVKQMYWDMAHRKNLIYGKDKTTGKPLSKPIELCDWKTLITGLRLALDQLEKGKSKSVTKHKTHSFYSEAIGIFNLIKDGWRNTISHGHDVNHDTKRKLFSPGETKDIMRDTERFMQRIATRDKL